MASHALLNAERVKWRFLLTSLGASAMLAVAAVSPIPLAAAAPTNGQLRDVARKDTLVVSGFGPGLSEIQDPTNMNPLLVGGTWPRSRYLEQDHLRIPVSVQPQHG